MPPRFTYHSEHHADRQDRWIHFLLFAGAFLLLLAGLYELFLFITDWNGADHQHSYYYLIFAVVYLAVGGLLTFAGIRHVQSHHEEESRFVKVDETEISWSLHPGPEVHRVVLADIKSVDRPNIRDLILHLENGAGRTLPIYLIANPEKQTELIAVLEGGLTDG